MKNLFYYIGLRHFQLKFIRVILNIVSIALGISLYVAISIINSSTNNSLKENIESLSGKAKLSVTSTQSGFDEKYLEAVRKTEGVKNAIPMVENRAFFVGATESTDALNILGVDLLQESSVRSYAPVKDGKSTQIIDDPLLFLNQPDSIILTKTFAASKKLKIDSKIRLATADGEKTFTVRGLLEPEGAAKAYGGSLAIMDIDGAQHSFGKESKLDRIDIIPLEGTSLETLKEKLKNNLPSGFHIKTPETQVEQLETMLKSYQLILTFFSTLALVVGLFLVINSVNVSVSERRKEIGTLRALGATKKMILAQFLTEIFFISLMGSVLGCFLGSFLSHRLVNEVTTSVSAQFQIPLQVTNLIFTPQHFIFSVVMGVLFSLFAALFPSLKATRIHPIEAMKKNSSLLNLNHSQFNQKLYILGFLFLISSALIQIYSLSRYFHLLEVAAKGLAILSVALLGPFLVFIFLKGTHALTPKNLFPLFRLSQKNLLLNESRTKSNITALMIGLFMVMLISIVRASFHHTLVDWLNDVFVADIMVTSNGRAITADVQPMKESFQNELLSVEGVKPVGENRGTGIRIIPFYYNEKKCALKAYDHFADFYGYRGIAFANNVDRIKTAKLLFESLEPRIFVTQNFLQKQSKKVGDEILLDTPSGKITFTILAEIIDYASPEGVLYMNREVYKKYFKDDLVTSFLVNKLEGADLETVRSNIDKKLGKKWNITTLSNAEFKNQMNFAVERTFAYTKAIEWIALLIALLGLLNTLLISVMERVQEIGVMRAIGSSRSQIFKMIFFETLLQGLFGTSVAILFASFVGYLFVNYGLSHDLGWIIHFHYPKASLATTFFIGIIVAVIAGIWPSLRASRLNITDALDVE